MPETRKIGNDIDDVSELEQFFQIIPYTMDHHSFSKQKFLLEIFPENSEEVFEEDLLSTSAGTLSFSLPKSFLGEIRLSSGVWEGFLLLDEIQEEDAFAMVLNLEMTPIHQEDSDQ